MSQQEILKAEYLKNFNVLSKKNARILKYSENQTWIEIGQGPLCFVRSRNKYLYYFILFRSSPNMPWEFVIDSSYYSCDEISDERLIYIREEGKNIFGLLFNSASEKEEWKRLFDEKQKRRQPRSMLSSTNVATNIVSNENTNHNKVPPSEMLSPIFSQPTLVSHGCHTCVQQQHPRDMIINEAPVETSVPSPPSLPSLQTVPSPPSAPSVPSPPLAPSVPSPPSAPSAPSAPSVPSPPSAPYPLPSLLPSNENSSETTATAPNKSPQNNRGNLLDEIQKGKKLRVTGILKVEENESIKIKKMDETNNVRTTTTSQSSMISSSSHLISDKSANSHSPPSSPLPSPPMMQTNNAAKISFTPDKSPPIISSKPKSTTDNGNKIVYLTNETRQNITDCNQLDCLTANDNTLPVNSSTSTISPPHSQSPRLETSPPSNMAEVILVHVSNRRKFIGYSDDDEKKEKNSSDDESRF